MDFLRKIVENVEVTLQKCIVNEGAYVEVLFLFHEWYYFLLSLVIFLLLFTMKW